MNCGNCGQANDYDATVCSRCGSTLALTEYFRPSGFVEKKNTPPEPKKEPWDQEILTDGYKKKPRPPVQEPQPPKQDKPAHSPAKKSSSPQSGTTPAKAPAKTAGNKKSSGTSQTKTPPAPKKITDNKTHKERSTPRVYNRTTKKLTLAERSVMKKDKKKSRKWIFPIILVLVLLLSAAAIFVGTMNAGSREDRFKAVATDFVYAVVMNDESRAADCIHPKMYGQLRPLQLQNVQRCETSAYSMEQVEPEALQQELSEAYGMTETITDLYRIRVGYTLYGEQTYGTTKSMDVLVAQIGNGIYAVKTENID